MSEVFFEVMSPLPLNTQEDARSLFDIWAKAAPDFLPDRSGLHEPLKHKFSLSRLEDAIQVWEFQFLLKRVAQPRLDSNVLMQYGPHRKHSTWSIQIKSIDDFDPLCFRALLEAASNRFSADFGFIHSLSAAELPRGISNGTITFLDTSRKRRNLFITTHTLRKYVPDIYWLTLFGRPYVRLFSKERLLSAPVYKVWELDNGAIALQLTPHIADALVDETALEDVRTSVRHHLNSNAIFDSKKGSAYKYQVPEFAWGPIVH